MGELASGGNPGSRETLRHLFAVAAEAREEETVQHRSFDSEAYDEIFHRMVQGVGETQKRLTRERKHGQTLWKALEKHPQARRLVMIENNRRFQTWGLFQVLIEHSHGIAGRDSQSALAMAELALAAARRLDTREHGEERTADFQAAALAAIADARRRLGDREGAWEAFEAAFEDLETGTGDPLERAELEILRARLLRDFGREEDADQAFRRAANLFRRIGDRRLETGEFAVDEPHHEATQRRTARG